VAARLAMRNPAPSASTAINSQVNLRTFTR
jgi:hypothetical protein